MSTLKSAYLIGLENWPCRPQTAEQIETYYRAIEPGDLACVRHTQYHYTVYEFVRVEWLRRGRIYLPQLGTFYAKSGKNCVHPKGQTKLVVPTEAIIAYVETHDMSVQGLHAAQIAPDRARTMLKEPRS